jgi:predicted DNA-binding transcriptional regulator AlpA
MEQDIRTGVPELFDVPGLANYLGVPVSTLYYWRSKGEGPPGFKVGKRLLYRKSDVADWLNGKRGELERLGATPEFARELKRIDEMRPAASEPSGESKA